MGNVYAGGLDHSTVLRHAMGVLYLGILNRGQMAPEGLNVPFPEAMRGRIGTIPRLLKPSRGGYFENSERGAGKLFGFLIRTSSLQERLFDLHHGAPPSGQYDSAPEMLQTHVERVNQDRKGIREATCWY